MTTTADLIAATRNHLMASGREQLNRLSGSISASATTLTFEFAAGQIAPGALLAIDLEVLYVWAISGTGAGSTATVQRGMFGSVAAAHSDDAMIYVNPLFTDFRIFQELNHELSSLSSPVNGLYRVKTVTRATTSAYSYDVASDALKVLAVQWNEVGPSSDWPHLRRWDLLSNQDPTVFTSGLALRLFEAPAPGRTIRISYAAPFGSLSGLTDDVQTVTGLPASANDIPPLGAAAKLLASREARRSSLDSQPETRQAQDVPPGTARSASGHLFALRDRRIREEAGRLYAAWPNMRKLAV